MFQDEEGKYDVNEVQICPAQSKKRKVEGPEPDDSKEYWQHAVANVARLISDHSVHDEPDIHQREVYYTSVKKKKRMRHGSAVDMKATGGVLGEDTRIINQEERYAHVTGDKEDLRDVPIGTGGALIESKQGPFIGIFHQYAISKKARSIHSHTQLAANGNTILKGTYPCSKGEHVLITSCNREIPLTNVRGITYMGIRPYSDEEYKRLPHVDMTSKKKWTPKGHQKDDKNPAPTQITVRNTEIVSSRTKDEYDDDELAKLIPRGLLEDKEDTAIKGKLYVKAAQRLMNWYNAKHIREMESLMTRMMKDEVLPPHLISGMFQEVGCDMRSSARRISSILTKYAKKDPNSDPDPTEPLPEPEEYKMTPTWNEWEEEVSWLQELLESPVIYSPTEEWFLDPDQTTSHKMVPPGGSLMTSETPLDVILDKPVPTTVKLTSPFCEGEKEIQNTMRNISPDPEDDAAQWKRLELQCLLGKEE